MNRKGPRGGTVTIKDDLTIEALHLQRELWLTIREEWDVLPANEADSADVLIRNVPNNRTPSIETGNDGQRWVNLPRGWRFRVQMARE